MAYYLVAFNLETCVAFADSPRDVVGFGFSLRSKAKAIRPGDRLIAYCYWPKFARWLGVLEVSDKYYIDDSLWLGEKGKPVRLKVRSLVWLSQEKSVPIHENKVLGSLLFTKEMDPSPTYDGSYLGSSLTGLLDEDGHFLEGLLIAQQSGGDVYPVDEEQLGKRRKRIRQHKERVRARQDGGDAEVSRKTTAPELPPVSGKAVTIAVPNGDRPTPTPLSDERSGEIRESLHKSKQCWPCAAKRWGSRSGSPEMIVRRSSKSGRRRRHRSWRCCR